MRHCITYILMVIIFIFLFAFIAKLSYGHSWYPSECCHDQHCHPADSVEMHPNGDVSVKVGEKVIVVPKGFPRKSSPDGNVHICYNDYGLNLVIYCFFVPGDA